jgi:phenylpropionate dioxygenase-like ring-hydroxylating dioxygenase large terminal subunit
LTLSAIIAHLLQRSSQVPKAEDTSANTLADGPDLWVVVAKSAALDIPRPVIPVTLRGQALVLFRDDEGKLGLIGRNCPHRGADLCFGRLEDNGLRCPFHGWHFDRSGQCVEQPAEPEGSLMYKQIKVPMIPVLEKDGVILAYIGAGEPHASDPIKGAMQ